MHTLETLDPATIKHFGLRDDPFAPPATPDEMHLPGTLVAFETRLETAIRRRGIVALTGPAGAGKSTITRRLWGRCARQQKIRLISPAIEDRRKITHTVLGIAILRDLLKRETASYSAEARSDLLRTTLRERQEEGEYPVLVIDEAHHLSIQGLLAVKHLWDSHTLFRQLAVIMVGQPLLAARLRSDPALAEVGGRTEILELRPYRANEVRDYLAWRLKRVGAELSEVFDDAAISAIALSARFPLWINNTAAAALTNAHAVSDRRVTAAHVRAAGGAS